MSQLVFGKALAQELDICAVHHQHFPESCFQFGIGEFSISTIVIFILRKGSDHESQKENVLIFFSNILSEILSECCLLES